MLWHIPNLRVASRSVLPVAFILIILGSIAPTQASTYYSLTVESQATVDSPKVMLQNGIVATSTIYANSTSAKASATAPSPTPAYYPSSYNAVTGTYLSGSVPNDVETVNNDCFIVRSVGTVNSTIAYNPLGYNLNGSTTFVSGTTSDVVSNNGAYMTFRSYASANSSQTLYAHQDTTTVGGTSYYLSKLTSADAAGTSLSASMSTTGRQLLGKYAYQLTGVGSIPASTWTMYYRGWRDSSVVAYDSQSSITQSTTATSISWNHTTGTGSNRLLLVAVGVHVSSGAPTTVTSVTYDGVSLTQVISTLYSTDTPQVRTYVFQLVNPTLGTKTIVVNFAAATLSVAGATTYANVDQTTPIQTSNSATGTGVAPSVSVTITGSGRCLFGYLGAHRTSSWSITGEGAGQTNRWARESENYKGRGSDKSVSSGSQSMSWTIQSGKPASYVASAVVINPAVPIGHIDVNILIRQSDGTIRTTIATNVGNSIDLTATATTLSATYAWTAYPVIAQTDYLEFDYYVEVTTATAGISAYLRIDDSSLPTADQTRAYNVYLPSEFTSELEFVGSSNTTSWSQLIWTVDSAWTTSSVAVTIQVYNHTLGGYPSSGNGYDSYTSSATENTDETRTQDITTAPTHFRNSTGYWKIKVKGVKATTTQFDFKADWVEYKSLQYTEYTVSTEFLLSSMTMNTPSQLNFTVVSEYDVASVSVTLQVWNYSASPQAYVTSDEGYQSYSSSGVNETKTLSINTNPQWYTSNGNAKIRLTGVLSTTTQYQQKANQIKLVYSYTALPSYDYVLRVNNTVADSWQIRLKEYADSSVDRLQNCTIYFRNSINVNSTQILIENGLFNQTEGLWHDLGNLETIYIAIAVEATSAETSYVYACLEVRKPDTTTILQYIITFEIT